MYEPDIQLIDKNVVVPSIHTIRTNLCNRQISFMNIPSTSGSSSLWSNNAVLYGLERDPQQCCILESGVRIVGIVHA